MSPSIAKLLAKYKTIEKERFFDEVFTKHEYKSVLSKKADVVFDIGACAGEFSAYMYDKAKEIYAFEPFAPHFKELTSNIKEFKLVKIKPFNVAISNTNGFGYLTTDDARGGNRLVPQSSNANLVKTITLASFMKQRSISFIDILKIDIEGGEELVFGSGDFKDIASKIHCIIGEHLNGEIQRILEEHGFEKTTFEGNQNVLYEKRIF